MEGSLKLKEISYIHSEAYAAGELKHGTISLIENGTPVYGQSAYRSYDRQRVLYDNAIKENGKFIADSDTARPGHSEHQTGLTIDVSSNKQGNMLNFDNTSSFYWMQNNAYKYGFILRYTKETEFITGYMNEPWHYRYVGKDIAKYIYEHPMTYEEYYVRFLEGK